MAAHPEDEEPGWKADPDDPSKQRYWNGVNWSPQGTTEAATEHSVSTDQDTEANPLAVALGFLGVALVGVGIFLPRFESTTFLRIEENSLIQGGEGAILAFLAVLAAFFIYRFTQKQGSKWSVFIVGLIVLFISVSVGTGDRLELKSVNSGPFSRTETATRGVGIYTVGAGGLLLTLSGAMLAGFAVGGVSPTPLRRTRTCPYCAESILVEAKVCKHCGRDVQGLSS